MFAHKGLTLAEVIALTVVAALLLFFACQGCEDGGDDDRTASDRNGTEAAHRLIGPPRRRPGGWIGPQARSWRVKCRANLHGIGKAFILYRAMNEDRWPFIRNDFEMDYDYPMAKTAASPWELGGKANELHVAENLNLLVHEYLMGWKMFRCPAQSDETMIRLGDGKKYGFGEDTDGDGRAEAVYLDYGYHNGYREPAGAGDDGNPAPLTRATASAALVVLGDQPPDVFYPSSLIVSKVNHGTAGLNVLRADGSVAWHEGPGTDAGFEGDPVFQSQRGNDGTPDSEHDTCLISPWAGQGRKEAAGP